MSVYEAQSRLIGIPEVYRSQLRLRGPQLESLSPEVYDQAVQVLRAYTSLGGLRLSATNSPWAQALAAGTVPTPAEAQAALNTASGIATHTWPQWTALESVEAPALGRSYAWL